jgi:hypothetical protein
MLNSAKKGQFVTCNCPIMWIYGSVTFYKKKNSLLYYIYVHNNVYTEFGFLFPQMEIGRTIKGGTGMFERRTETEYINLFLLKYVQ